MKGRVAAAVAEMRHRAGLHELVRHDLAEADQDACSMAQADRLGTLPIQKLAKQYTVLTYTSLHPETLPSGSSHAIASRNVRNFSVGACYARTETYPTGAYWIVLSLD